MGKNAYINFYMWYYNEHRGQAPVTKIAKNAGVCWRKMTPQEKEKFYDKDFQLKHRLPMYIHSKKAEFRSPLLKRRHKHMNNRKIKIKSQYKGERKINARKRRAPPSLRSTHHRNSQSLGKTISKNTSGSCEMGNGKDLKEEDSNDEGHEEEDSETSETISRRKSIQKWMDENHYT